ncbi:DGQHR domain-containing protein [Streptomonospora nanhaiensis]|uniref:DGQHR domain-containing protein n=1 Tax=Streptomonospora nanhaiensis TaxID=1323731 RepID=A0A853BR09_9ACTN|nr:DGQHR domain-containing protein DpdB [Streptomonospora nanhaiensis]NYI97126.1 DGQHR domain-containing protein [Streptomonospora nanhaiensis]
MGGRVLKRRALRIHQHSEVPLYVFTLAAEEVSQVADVARISRDDAGKLIGYQRPEKKQHVKQILEYLDSDEVLFPNGLILALPKSVRFRSSPGPSSFDGLATSGTLEIPLPESDAEPRPAWIVDGQQRSLALSRTRRTRLPVTAAGFVAEDIPTQREQFLRVNTVSPLPSNLVSELLPEVWTPLPAKLSARKLPSALVDVLNQDPESPLRGMIKRASTGSDKRGAVIADNGLITAIEESLNSSAGILFLHRNLSNNTTDTVTIRRLLITYWSAVRETFPNAWGLPPTKSRLMHGVGIRAMGRLMDKVMANVDLNTEDPILSARGELSVIKEQCHWTQGRWPELGVNWNELQNTPRHISTLSNFLIRVYVQARASAS